MAKKTRAPDEDIITIEEPANLFDGKTMTLEEIREEIGDCTRCQLHEGRTNLVFGDGNPKARLMFVGEGPGRDEDMQGSHQNSHPKFNHLRGRIQIIHFSTRVNFHREAEKENLRHPDGNPRGCERLFSCRLVWPFRDGVR